MKLPALDAQTLYLDVGWGIVVAAAVVAIAQAGRAPLDRRALAMLAGLTLATMWLPGAWAPSFWLGMAFQYPSQLLVILSGMHLLHELVEPPGAPRLQLLPPLPAATLAVLGCFLYAGAFTWIPLDVYDLGHDDYATAILASALAIGWYALGWRNALACAAVAVAALVHAVTGLPSGNAWDTLIDPMLFTYAAVSSLAAASMLRRSANAPKSHAITQTKGAT